MSKNNNTQNELFSQVNTELTVFCNALVHKLENPLYQSDSLNRKSISQFSGKIFKLLSDKGGNQKDAQQSKDIFLKIVESHLTNYINNHIVVKLIRNAEDYVFAEMVSRGWTDYKRVLFSFFALFIHVKDYYQTARVTQSNKVKVSAQSKLEQNSLPLPIPAIGVILFNNLILRRFQMRIKRAILQLLKRERQLGEPSNNNLTLILQAIWGCSLKELARIAISKDSIYFFKQERKQFTNVFKDAANNQQFINEFILNDMCKAAAQHYSELGQSIRLLNGIQQIQMINIKCELEEEITRYHFPSKASSATYLNAIYKEIILNDFEEILRKSFGFKHIISHFSHTSEQLQRQVQNYFKVIKRVDKTVLDQVIKVVNEVISERGEQIKEKLNKPRQFMTDMLHFKKSLRKMFAIVETDALRVQIAMEKGFKNLMDGYEVSKSLAQFTDYTIRQCSRLKLDESASEEKLKQIIFMLTSVSAKDLFLVYHQDGMAKRLLDSLNQPKLDHQVLLLKLLADNLGNIMLNQHLSMIKDIQSSIEITENLSKNLPFISYKWDLRVINSIAWPDSALKPRFSHISPPTMLRHHLYQLEDLYKQYRGFALQWKLDRGTSLFQGRFAKGKWRFQAENVYMMILLHFNDLPKYTMKFSQLSKVIVSQKRENEKNGYLENFLKVLIENRLILRSQSKNPHDDFNPDEDLQVNMQYAPNEQTKPGQTIIIKMSPQLAKLLNQNNVQVNKVIKDRQKLVDALLVKLLKHAHSTGNNRITFIQLYEGIKNNPYLSNFNFTQTAVKQRLEQLVSKEYCRRDEQDRRVYHYIA